MSLNQKPKKGLTAQAKHQHKKCSKPKKKKVRPQFKVKKTPTHLIPCRLCQECELTHAESASTHFDKPLVPVSVGSHLIGPNASLVKLELTVCGNAHAH